MKDTERIISQCLREVTYDLVRASGPGGQNVNKVATAVQLRFDAAHSTRLDAAARHRLLGKAGKRATAAGVIIIQASRHRTQDANRQDGRNRLRELLKYALTPPKKRLPTRATAASKERRLKAKKLRSSVKRLRQSDDA
jgi:ribosome-associated protein